MPIGVFTNCGAVLLGGLLGTFLGKVLPETLKEHLPTMFGLCSIAIGVNSVIKASGMTAVVLAILLLVFGGRKASGGRADAAHVRRPFGMRRRFDHGRRIPRFADQIGPAGGLDAGIDLGDAVQSIMVESDAVT